MKILKHINKILVILIIIGAYSIPVCILLSSCTPATTVTNPDTGEYTVNQDNGIKLVYKTGTNHQVYNIVEVTYRNETHEFLQKDRGEYGITLSHWPSCKYCKNN